MKKISLQDIDRLDGGSLDKMLEEASKLTSNKDEQVRLVSEKISLEFRIKRLKDIEEEKNKKDNEIKEEKRKSIMEEKEDKDKEKRRKEIKEGKQKMVCEEEKIKIPYKSNEDKLVIGGNNIRPGLNGRTCISIPQKNYFENKEGKKKKVCEEKKKKIPYKSKVLGENNIIPKQKSKINIQGIGLGRTTCIPIPLKNYLKNKGINVNDTKLVIAKKLFQTDVCKNQCRFTAPINQVMCDDFLTKAEEKEVTLKKGMQVNVIEPCLNERSMRLRKWKINNSYSYTIIGGWGEVLKNNSDVLQKDNLIQLRCFRHEGKLGLTISEVVGPEEDEDCGGNGEDSRDDGVNIDQIMSEEKNDGEDPHGGGSGDGASTSTSRQKSSVLNS